MLKKQKRQGGAGIAIQANFFPGEPGMVPRRLPGFNCF
jgi:hypothetical protein